MWTMNRSAINSRQWWLGIFLGFMLVSEAGAATLADVARDRTGKAIKTTVYFRPVPRSGSRVLATEAGLHAGWEKNVPSDTNGVFSVTLVADDYDVFIGPDKLDTFRIWVPDTTNTYTLRELTTNALVYSRTVTAFVERSERNATNGWAGLTNGLLPLWLMGTGEASEATFLRGDGTWAVGGLNGTNGVDGVDGVDGMDGATGPEGPAGPQGPPGDPASTNGLAGIDLVMAISNALWQAKAARVDAQIQGSMFVAGNSTNWGKVVLYYMLEPGMPGNRVEFLPTATGFEIYDQASDSKPWTYASGAGVFRGNQEFLGTVKANDFIANSVRITNELILETLPPPGANPPIKFLTGGAGMAMSDSGYTVADLTNKATTGYVDAATATRQPTNANLTAWAEVAPATYYGAGVVVNVYTNPGTYTWSRPAGAVWYRASGFGGGGGGSSGRRGAAGTDRSGGPGGSGGNYSEVEGPAVLLGETETVVVGGGGVGGEAVETDSTNGRSGANGTNSSFGTWVAANAGGGGGAAGTTGGTRGAGSLSVNSMWYSSGGYGATGTNGPGLPGNVSVGYSGAPGGGSGGGLGADDVSKAGGNGAHTSGPYYWAAVAGGAAGAAGSNGQSRAAGLCYAGNSGSGGGGNSVGPGGNGGHGGNYGAGGGGGGASVNGYLSGAGGNGGSGIVVVVTYLSR